MEPKEYYRLKALEGGFASIDEYVRANLHYLPKDRQDLFQKIFSYETSTYGKNQH